MSTTNFFQAVAAIGVAGLWKITIQDSTDNKLVVSVLLSDGKCGDEAQKKVPPIILHGTPQELDEGFFEAITTPVLETAQLFANMEQYLKEREQARAASQMEKDKESRDKKDKEERKKKFEEKMKKVSELEEAKKWQEAIANMPKAGDFPEQAEEIAKRLDALRQKNGQLTLI